MPDRVSLVTGAASGLAGLFMLARQDIPLMYHGGPTCILAGLDLFAAAVVVCAVLGLVTREW